MDDAWQSQEMAPPNGGGISIPVNDTTMSNGGPGEDHWNRSPRGGRSPSRGEERPRRSSRSRSPGRPAQRESGGNNPGNNLHVSGLKTKVDNRALEDAFAACGRVIKVQVMYDPHTRESRGFGFVTMQTGEEADAAIATFSELPQGDSRLAFNNGDKLSVEKARRGRARTPTPGRYYGPPKRNLDDRPYDPRPYDSRYNRYDDHHRPRGRYDEDYRGPPRDYDRGGYGRENRDYDRQPYGRDYERRYDERRY